MKKNWTKYLSVLLSVLMLVAMLTVGVSASTNYDPTGQQQSSQTSQGNIDWNGPSNYPSRPNAPMNPAPNDDYEEEDNDSFDIIVRKKWVGDNESTRPEEVLVQLIQNGDPIGNPVALSASRKEESNWKHTWTGLDEDGEYTIVEINTPEGYTSVVEHVRGNYWTITNTYNSAPSYSSAPAVKDNPETGAAFVGDAGLALLFCCAVGVACVSRK